MRCSQSHTNTHTHTHIHTHTHARTHAGTHAQARHTRKKDSSSSSSSSNNNSNHTPTRHYTLTHMYVHPRTPKVVSGTSSTLHAFPFSIITSTNTHTHTPLFGKPTELHSAIQLGKCTCLCHRGYGEKMCHARLSAKADSFDTAE